MTLFIIDGHECSSGRYMIHIVRAFKHSLHSGTTMERQRREDAEGGEGGVLCVCGENEKSWLIPLKH